MQFRFVKLLVIALTAWLLVACAPIPLESINAAVASQSAVANAAGPSAARGTSPAKLVLQSQSVVTDTVGPSTASDPAQARAEDEFLAVVKAKERAFYEGDVERTLSYYADGVISVYPETEEVVGKAALAEGLRPYLENNRIVGTFTVTHIWVHGDHATRQGRWDEVATPKNGGPAEHHIGRCTLNWDKIDGQWKVVSEFVNYLVPPTEIK